MNHFFVLVFVAFFTIIQVNGNFVNYSPYVYNGVQRLFRRDIVVCDNGGIYATGSDISAAISPPLSKIGDSYLEAFVAPKSGFLCSLSMLISNDVSNLITASLYIYNDTTSEISIVNGTASDVSSTVSGTKTSILSFPFCANAPALISGATYIFKVTLGSGPSLQFVFGDTSAQGLVFGPTYPDLGQAVASGVTFNLTIGNSNPSCTLTTTTTLSTTTSTLTSTTKTRTTTETTTKTSTTDTTTTDSSIASDTTTTTTDYVPTTTGNFPFPVPSGSVYCYCRGVVRVKGILKKRQIDDDEGEEEDDDEFLDDKDNEFQHLSKKDEMPLGLEKRTQFFWDTARNVLDKRSNNKYVVKFKTSCGKFKCRCKPTKSSSSNKPLPNFWNCS